MKDKRSAKRDKHDSVIELLNAAGKVTDSGRLVDFSSSGAAFYCAKSFAAGAKVRARVRLPEKGALEFHGEVVWSRKEGAGSLSGVKFDSIMNVYPSGELKRPSW